MNSNEVTKCKNFDNFGTLRADSKHIGNSTPNMLLTTHNVIYIHPKFMNMQALLHTCIIRSKLSKTHFVVHRPNLLAARPIKVYMVPLCGSLETLVVILLQQCCVFQNRGGPSYLRGPY